MTKLFLISLLAIGASAQQRNEFIQFDWNKLAARAVEKVDVNLDGSVLELARNFLKDKGDEARIRQAVGSLKGVYVKTFEFDKDGQYSEADLKEIRSQLRAPQWSPIVDVKEKTESVTVHLKMQGKIADGIIVVAAEPRELTVVQIVGPIDPAMLAELGGHMGIPKMEFGPLLKGKGQPAKKED